MNHHLIWLHHMIESKKSDVACVPPTVGKGNCVLQLYCRLLMMRSNSQSHHDEYEEMNSILENTKRNIFEIFAENRYT